MPLNSHWNKTVYLVSNFLLYVTEAVQGQNTNEIQNRQSAGMKGNNILPWLETANDANSE